MSQLSRREKRGIFVLLFVSAIPLWSVGPDAKNDGGTAIVYRSLPTRIPAPKQLPWQKSLPTILPESTGDVVAGATH